MDFTNIVASIPAQKLVDELNDIFQKVKKDPSLAELKPVQERGVLPKESVSQAEEPIIYEEIDQEEISSIEQETEETHQTETTKEIPAAQEISALDEAELKELENEDIQELGELSSSTTQPKQLVPPPPPPPEETKAIPPQKSVQGRLDLPCHICRVHLYLRYGSRLRICLAPRLFRRGHYWTR